jgi:hypothetical protein
MRCNFVHNYKATTPFFRWFIRNIFSCYIPVNMVSWKLKPSGLWSRVDWWLVTDVCCLHLQDNLRRVNYVDEMTALYRERSENGHNARQRQDLSVPQWVSEWEVSMTSSRHGHTPCSRLLGWNWVWMASLMIHLFILYILSICIMVYSNLWI